MEIVIELTVEEKAEFDRILEKENMTYEQFFDLCIRWALTYPDKAKAEISRWRKEQSAGI